MFVFLKNQSEFLVKASLYGWALENGFSFVRNATDEEAKLARSDLERLDKVELRRYEALRDEQMKEIQQAFKELKLK